MKITTRLFIIVFILAGTITSLSQSTHFDLTRTEFALLKDQVDNRLGILDSHITQIDSLEIKGRKIPFYFTNDLVYGYWLNDDHSEFILVEFRKFNSFLYRSVLVQFTMLGDTSLMCHAFDQKDYPGDTFIDYLEIIATQNQVLMLNASDTILEARDQFKVDRICQNVTISDSCLTIKLYGRGLKSQLTYSPFSTDNNHLYFTFSQPNYMEVKHAMNNIYQVKNNNRRVEVIQTQESWPF